MLYMTVLMHVRGYAGLGSILRFASEDWQSRPLTVYVLLAASLRIMTCVVVEAHRCSSANFVQALAAQLHEMRVQADHMKHVLCFQQSCSVSVACDVHAPGNGYLGNIPAGEFSQLCEGKLPAAMTGVLFMQQYGEHYDRETQVMVSIICFHPAVNMIIGHLGFA